MTPLITRRLRTIAVIVLCTLPILVAGDEGMWTFDNPPLKVLKERYGFAPTQTWLDHLREASVRFNDGGSGSFVSADGLVLTNHHVARGQLQKVSTEQKNYAANGFYARTPADEIKCPDLELNVLMSLENVTALVQGAIKTGLSDRDALQARRAEIARIEKESLDRTGLRSDVVTLYQGGEYWLYRYKRYTDIRIVFAPEEQTAFFGGDPDNFTYPRYDLDFAIFRVYDEGKPVRPAHYLKWNNRPVSDGELVFVSGHPGSTSRQNTVAQLEYARDVTMPATLTFLKNRLAALRAYAKNGQEAQREADDLIFGLENARKAYEGEYGGLKDRDVMAKKEAEERDLRAAVQARPELSAAFGGAWDVIADALQKAGSTFKTRFYSSVTRSQAALPGLALTIVQYVTEVAKPDAERLPGFHDAQLESLRFELLSPAPVYPDMDTALLASWLQEGLTALGPDDPVHPTILGGRDPADLARELIDGTKVGDPAVRQGAPRRRPRGGRRVDRSADRARRGTRSVRPRTAGVDGNQRRRRRCTAASEKIGRARFAIYGKSVSPDATFTLRLSYGTVKGYPMNGTLAPRRTTLFGLYDRASGLLRQAAVQSAPPLRRAPESPRSLDAGQFRVHRRHHRRQLRIAGRQPRGRTGRPHLRRQHREPGRDVRLQRGEQPGRRGVHVVYQGGPDEAVRRGAARGCARRARRPRWRAYARREEGRKPGSESRLHPRRVSAPAWCRAARPPAARYWPGA